MRLAQLVLLAAFATFVNAAPLADVKYRQEVMDIVTDDGYVAPTLVSYPKDGMNPDGPALIHIHGGPGASPLAGSGPWLGTGLASLGYTIIAPLPRHGAQLHTHTFEQVNLDIKAAIDFLEARGFRDIVLTGSSYGSICTTRYLVDTQDPRVKANIHFAPTGDLEKAVRRRAGDKYSELVEEVASLVRQNKGDTVVATGFSAQTAEAWLDIWGPASKGNNTELIGLVKPPILLLWGDGDAIHTRESIADLKARAVSSSRVDTIIYEGGVNHSFYPVHDEVVVDVTKWLKDIGLGPKPRVLTEVVTINEGPMGRLPGNTDPMTGDLQRGLQYRPAIGSSKATAVIILHDWDTDAMSGVSRWLAPALAQAGHTAIGINAVRGEIEQINAKFESSDGYVRNWVDHFNRTGFKRIVLAGHGMGALRAAHYMAATQDKRVNAVVALAPTSDPSQWMSSAMGPQNYQATVATAENLVKSGTRELVQYTATLPPPAEAGGGIRITMWPDAFLNTWGPQAPKAADQFARAEVPVLLLAGSEGRYLDQAAFNALARAGTNVQSEWYADAANGADHNLRGFEDRAARDIVEWLASAKGGTRAARR